jgi:hypothetical protein
MLLRLLSGAMDESVRIFILLYIYMVFNIGRRKGRIAGKGLKFTGWSIFHGVTSLLGFGHGHITTAFISLRFQFILASIHRNHGFIYTTIIGYSLALNIHHVSFYTLVR